MRGIHEKEGEERRVLTYLWPEHRRPKLLSTPSPELQATQTRKEGRGGFVRKKEKKGENATTKRETEQAKEGTMEGAREGGRQPNLAAAVQHHCLTSSPLTFPLLLPQKSSSPAMTGRQIWPRRGEEVRA